MRKAGLWAMLAVAVASPVHAQPAADAIAEAEQLFEDARALLEEGRFAEACDRFARSFELGGIIGAELNLGDCAERDGRLAAAWRLFDAAARDWERQDDRERARFARASAARVATRLATIVVKLADAPHGVAVRIGDRELPPAREIRELVDPDTVEVVVTLPGQPPIRRTIDARAGATTTLDVSAGAPSATAAPPPGEPAPTTRARAPVTALVLGGTAIALAGGGLGLWRWSASTYDKAKREPGDSEQRDLVRNANRQYHIAQGLGVASVACAGVAVWLYLRRRSPERSAANAARITVAPVLGGEGVGLLLGGRY